MQQALAALDSGDAGGLRALLDEHPELVYARTNVEPPYNYFTGATLLHHIAGNPYRDGVRLPENIVEIGRVLLERGAEVDALTLGPPRGTTMGLVITAKQASDRNLSGALIDLLLEFGAALDVREIDLPLSNHAPRAAEKLIELGAPVDLCVSAALGRMDELRALKPRQGLSTRDSIGLAALFAYANRQWEAFAFLLEHDGNWNMTGVQNGTILHRAAWDGDLRTVQTMVAKGADVANRDNPFASTPLSWAEHNKQEAVVEWLRANGAEL